ncbi:hypothetical protein [Sphingomonas sp. MA1305]|nr:hypothetical protein [Sphingomonas sp. MA1305]
MTPAVVARGTHAPIRHRPTPMMGIVLGVLISLILWALIAAAVLAIV